MKFIRINDGLSVRKDNIICVEVNLEGGCQVYTEIGMYISNFSYETILSLLERDDEVLITKEKNKIGPWEFSGQHWAG